LIEQSQKPAIRFNFFRASKTLLAFLTMPVDIAGVGHAEKKQPSIPAGGAIANMILDHEAHIGRRGTVCLGTNPNLHE
jgi:hypothetical protein